MIWKSGIQCGILKRMEIELSEKCEWTNFVKHYNVNFLLTNSF